MPPKLFYLVLCVGLQACWSRPVRIKLTVDLGVNDFRHTIYRGVYVVYLAVILI